MNKDTLKDQLLDTDRLQQIPVWARRYAQNRTLGMVVQLGIFLVGFGVRLGFWFFTALCALMAVAAAAILRRAPARIGGAPPA